MYESLEDTGDKFISIGEIRFNVDEIHFEDNIYHVGESPVSKYILNMHLFRKNVMDWREYYTVQDRYPIKMFCFGLYNQGKIYKRNVYNILSFLRDLGGLSDSLIFICKLLVWYIFDVFIKTRFIEVLAFLLLDYTDSEEIQQK